MVLWSESFVRNVLSALMNLAERLLMGYLLGYSTTIYSSNYILVC